MANQPLDPAAFRVVVRARALFWERGYAAVTMTQLADACRLTRRGLYHHFSSKEELFRATLRLGNVKGFEAGDRAARRIMAQDGSALDVLAGWLDARFGEIRREVGRTPHGQELNAVSFRIGHDIMIEVSQETHSHLAALIRELCTRGKLRLRPGITPEEAATLIGDGARGVNQARPPVPNNRIAERYRRIAEAVLYGCAERSAG